MLFGIGQFPLKLEDMILQGLKLFIDDLELLLADFQLVSELRDLSQLLLIAILAIIIAEYRKMYLVLAYLSRSISDLRTPFWLLSLVACF